MPARRPATRNVVIVTFPGLQPLDVAGPAEVFGAAALLAPGSYTARVLAPAREPLASRAGGYAILPDGALADAPAAIDTLLIAGGTGVREAVSDAALVDWVRRTAARARRVASVCTGSFLLAEAGVLDGRRATTHWASCAELALRHPRVTVEREPIFVRDGRIWTSAGVTAGMDLALAMVEDDLGSELARRIARRMVVFLQRPGGQAQFSAHLRAPARREPLRELQAWMADHLDADLHVEALAERACMSPRHFARAFRDETGQTPAAYVEELRVEAARAHLEGGAEPVEAVAARTGFGTPETMRRAFARRLGVAPGDYRARFGRASGHAA